MFPVWEVEIPALYGLFHLSFLGLSLGLTLGLLFLFRRGWIHRPKWIVFGFGIFLLGIELYKQWYLLSQGWAYSVNNIPFQFCSTVIYVSLLAPLLNPSKGQDALYSYLALYCSVSGLSVMLYPGTVFGTNLILNVHTMLWHGSMVCVSFFAWFSRPTLSLKRATLVFVTLMAIAFGLNIASYHLPFLPGGQASNFFYIGPYLKLNHPVINAIYEAGGLGLFVSLYFSTFFLGATLLVAFRKKIKRLDE